MSAVSALDVDAPSRGGWVCVGEVGKREGHALEAHRAGPAEIDELVDDVRLHVQDVDLSRPDAPVARNGPDALDVTDDDLDQCEGSLPCARTAGRTSACADQAPQAGSDP